MTRPGVNDSCEYAAGITGLMGVLDHEGMRIVLPNG
jgi:hypothetical protein